jgi:hypothetical protein
MYSGPRHARFLCARCVRARRFRLRPPVLVEFDLARRGKLLLLGLQFEDSYECLRPIISSGRTSCVRCNATIVIFTKNV